MKINIITFHFAHNFGAVLQCFALQEKLMELGHAVEVINYRPRYHTRVYSCLTSPFRYYRDSIGQMDTEPCIWEKAMIIVKAMAVNRKAVRN